MIADLIKDRSNIKLLNPYKGTARLSVSESKKRAAFRTNAAKNKLAAIVEAAKKPLGLK
jgi:hypothetical protein